MKAKYIRAFGGLFIGLLYAWLVSYGYHEYPWPDAPSWSWWYIPRLLSEFAVGIFVLTYMVQGFEE